MKREEQTEELWDEYSEYLDSDIDTLAMQIGTDWMSKAQFVKAIEAYHKAQSKDTMPSERCEVCKKELMPVCINCGNIN